MDTDASDAGSADGNNSHDNDTNPIGSVALKNSETENGSHPGGGSGMKSKKKKANSTGGTVKS